MLNPSMSELMNKVNNRYLLVNLAAQRARNLADEADQVEEPLPDKAVQMALEDIASGSIVYRPGPMEEGKSMQMQMNSGLGMLDLDFSDDEDAVENNSADEDEDVSDDEDFKDKDE